MTTYTAWWDEGDGIIEVLAYESWDSDRLVGDMPVDTVIADPEPGDALARAGWKLVGPWQATDDYYVAEVIRRG